MCPIQSLVSHSIEIWDVRSATNVEQKKFVGNSSRLAVDARSSITVRKSVRSRIGRSTRKFANPSVIDGRFEKRVYSLGIYAMLEIKIVMNEGSNYSTQSYVDI